MSEQKDGGAGDVGKIILPKDVLKSGPIVPPKLHSSVREMSYKEIFKLNHVFSDVRGMHMAEHVCLNVIPPSNELLVFSINPQIAYDLFSTKNIFSMDAGISRTFWDNFNCYFWDEGYYPETYGHIKLRKELKYGIQDGVIFVRKILGYTFVFSFATQGNAFEFRESVAENALKFQEMGIYCLRQALSVVEKYLPKTNEVESIFKHINTMKPTTLGVERLISML